MCIYIYVYIYKEREREKWRDFFLLTANAHLSINITFRDPTWAFETQKVVDQRQRLKSARNVPPLSHTF